MNKDYEIYYLPLFQDDLMKTVYYISNILENPDAALKLVDDVEKVILKRSQNPLSFEPFRSKHKRKHSYYRIYIRNYVIFYVVIGNVMEVRRFLYNKRDISEYL